MRAPLIALALGLLAAPALAQDASVEDKLRDALRRSTVDLRALQDSQAQLQADRDSAKKQADTLTQQLADANAKIAELQAKTPQAGPPADQQELMRLNDALQAAQAQINALSSSLAKSQAAYQQEAALARQKDAEAKQLGQQLGAERKVTSADLDANKKLADLAKEILHLYRTNDFRNLLLKSYEPLLGFYQVKLDNTVQAYEDRIYDLRRFKQ